MNFQIDRKSDKKNNIKIWLFLFLFVFALEFWVSINSYTHDLYNRIDSAIFFMSGKAWMNGMIPYVDFADAKGPLLWLIFGIGYLFSHYNYLGIFWIECIFYTVTFFYCYKIGCLFLSDKKTALLCSMLMALSFFCGAYHYETRAEDFCQPFIAGGLYYTLRALYGSQRDKDIKIASLVVGIGFASTLLIKFTIAAMILILFFALFCYLIKCRKDLIGISFIYAFLGIFLTLFPFILYFFYQGNFHDFIYAYFSATSQTIVKTPTLGGMIKDYIVDGWGSLLHLNLFRSFVVCFLLVNIIGGCIFFYKKLSTFKWFPAVIALWFICISMYHALGYYYHSFAIFAIFPIIMYLTFFNRFVIIKKKRRLVFYASLIVVIVFLENITFLRPNFFLNKTEERNDFYYVNRILSQVANPKIMFSFYDTGYGTPAHALPGCRYWTGQYGVTEKMISERALAIKEQYPDFVFVLYDYEYFTNLLQQSGYVKYYSWMTQEATYRYQTYLYGKPGLSLPPDDFHHISPMDVLLKKRILPDRTNRIKSL